MKCARVEKIEVVGGMSTTWRNRLPAEVISLTKGLNLLWELHALLLSNVKSFLYKRYRTNIDDSTQSEFVNKSNQKKKKKKKEICEASLILHSSLSHGLLQRPY